MQHTLLEPTQLGDAAAKALASTGPARMMAARGLAPLPRAADLVSVLYQLALDPNDAIKTAAEKSAGELPEKILSGALNDASLDARVLDFFAGKVHGTLIEAILLNRSTADETVAVLASRVGEREIELIAQNEERLLRAPTIITAMYMNAKARMSTVDRAVELAVRNQVVVPGVPAWENIVATVLGTKQAPSPAEVAATDAAFADATKVAVDETTEASRAAETVLAENAPTEQVEAAAKKLPIDKLSIPAKIRLATLGNAFARSLLVRDSNKQVALAAIRSPKVTDDDVVKYSANRSLCDDVIRLISSSKEWLKVHQIKVNLVNNPKCPLPTSMKLLPFLHDKELRAVARSKGIPTALSSQAKKLLAAKASGGDG